MHMNFGSSVHLVHGVCVMRHGLDVGHFFACDSDCLASLYQYENDAYVML